MNKAEARSTLAECLERYRAKSYDELRELLDKPVAEEVIVESGVRYYIEVEVFWDDRPGGNLRIIGAIDDGGWRAFSPLTDSFILAADGSFVGE